MKRKQKLFSRLKREAVLCIAALCAALSSLIVPPDAAYLRYVDVRVLCLLFCLMAVVAGLQSCGLFEVLAQKILSRCTATRPLVLTLVALPFFCSMLITNDVALILFVPFAMLVLALIGRTQMLPWVIVLQTLAANLGSVATQVGNPQNLYLYARYGLLAGEFFAVTLPVAAFSLLLLCAAALLLTRQEGMSIRFSQPARVQNHKLLALYGGLFLISLLAVFHALYYAIATAAVASCLLLFSPALLKRVDYSLLLTFVCFFIFAGNMGRIPAVHHLLTSLLAQNALLSSVLASQIISNVPAAVLLSGFTEDWRALLLGVDVGGLGTPVASLASLISLKLYLRTPKARPAYYLGLFTLANLIGLAALLPLAWAML